MKSLLLCFLVVILGVTKVKSNEIPQEIQAMVVGVRDKCHRETGVDIEHVDRTVEGYFHPSELLGCYFSCIFNHFNLLDNDGHLDWVKVVNVIPPSFKDHADEMIAACKTTTGKDPCDSAVNIVQCFQKTNPAKYFVIPGAFVRQFPSVQF
nr:putative odorant binding protein 3a [Nasonia vitripennis]